jgi:RimJ/RimL family protein N-acetyltransferase
MQVDRLIADSPRIQRWMHEKSGLPILEGFHGIAREVDGKIVAAFGFDWFQKTCCAMHLCLDSPTSMNRALLRKAFEVPFIQWNFDYLFVIIQVENARSLNMATRLGYRELAILPDALWFGAMQRSECRWLKLPE